MPLINGQKMACEPCIRGHRSTKCTHANERLMVPVRKPGRPLSSCPHPSSRTCSCAAVTAAIPRKHQCRCGPSPPAAAAAAAVAAAKDAPGADTAPPSPSKPAGPAFRVQKPGSRSAPGRKPSVDLAGLERMDASQFNFLPAAYGGLQQPAPVSNGHAAPMPDVAMYGAMGLAPSESSFGPAPAMFPVFPYPLQSPAMAPPRAKPAANGHGGTPTDASTTASAGPTPGRCCGDGADGARQAQAAATQPMAAPAPAANGAGESKPDAGCCFPGPADPPETKPPAESIMMTSFQPQIPMANGIYPYFSQPSIVNYPPQFGSFLQPLQPEQWRQLMAAMSLGPDPAPGAFGMTMHSQSTANGGAPWTSHQCSCGDSCQCVGCAAHPYNEATQNYVRSAWNTMMEDGQQKTRAPANGHAHPVNGSMDGNHDCSVGLASNGTTTPVTSQAEGPRSPVPPQTPSDGASGASEEQTFSASDFFFVSYPFGESCAGETTSCPCGDDCQCIGCVIHNNPGPEQMADEALLL